MKTIQDNLGSVSVCLIEMLAGILLLISPVGLTTCVIVIVGVALTVCGADQIVRYFRGDAATAAAGQGLVKGLLATAGGVFCMAKSKWFLTAFPALTLLYGVITLVVGLFKVQMTVDRMRLRQGKWGWSACSAALALLIAAVIFVNPFGATGGLWRFIALGMIGEAAFDMLCVALSAGKG